MERKEGERRRGKAEFLCSDKFCWKMPCFLYISNPHFLLLTSILLYCVQCFSWYPCTVHPFSIHLSLFCWILSTTVTSCCNCFLMSSFHLLYLLLIRAIHWSQLTSLISCIPVFIHCPTFWSTRECSETHWFTESCFRQHTHNVETIY